MNDSSTRICPREYGAREAPEVQIGRSGLGDWTETHQSESCVSLSCSGRPDWPHYRPTASCGSLWTVFEQGDERDSRSARENLEISRRFLSEPCSCGPLTFWGLCFQSWKGTLKVQLRGLGLEETWRKLGRAIVIVLSPPIKVSRKESDWWVTGKRHGGRVSSLS